MQICSTKLQAVKTEFFLNGESVAEWARAHGFRRDMVYAVLSGRCKGLRGQSHQIAQHLGLKPATAADTPHEEDGEM